MEIILVIGIIYLFITIAKNKKIKNKKIIIFLLFYFLIKILFFFIRKIFFIKQSM